MTRWTWMLTVAASDCHFLEMAQLYFHDGRDTLAWQKSDKKTVKPRQTHRLRCCNESEMEHG
jgi:hypothetical protein